MRYSSVGIALTVAMAAHGQTQIDLRGQTKNVDFSAAAITKPNKMGPAVPVSCTAGETFFKTSAPAGQNLYGCVAANTWALLGGNPAHTHPLTDLQGITGKEGTGGALQAFGGGSVAANDCAKFDASGNVVSSGAPCDMATSLRGLALDGAAPNSAAQFYGWSPGDNQLTLYSFGRLLSISGQMVDVATESVPQYAASETLPGACSQYGVFHFNTAAGYGAKLYYCNGSAYEPVGAGLPDPGADGLLKRSGANTAAIAAPGVDYYRPGSAIAASDLPLPSLNAGGKVQARTCSAGDFVNSINGDSSVACSTPAGIRATQ